MSDRRLEDALEHARRLEDALEHARQLEDAPEVTQRRLAVCEDDDSGGGWLNQYSCAQLEVWGWCAAGHDYEVQTNNRCPVACDAPCTDAPTGAPTYAPTAAPTPPLLTNSVIDSQTHFRVACLCDSGASVQCNYRNNQVTNDDDDIAWVAFGTSATYNAPDCTWTCGDWGTGNPTYTHQITVTTSSGQDFAFFTTEESAASMAPATCGATYAPTDVPTDAPTDAPTGPPTDAPTQVGDIYSICVYALSLDHQLTLG
jgi:hypothetical protein